MSNGECMFTYWAEKCGGHPGGTVALCTHAAAALRVELALARDTAFWLDCRWKEPSQRTNERGANACLLEGTKVCAVCLLADAEARVRELEGQGADPVAYPNLNAVIEGRVSADAGQWPQVRVELRALLGRLSCAEAALTAAQG